MNHADFFRSLCERGHRRVTQTKLRRALGDALFNVVFEWTQQRLLETGEEPLQLSEIVQLSRSEPSFARDRQLLIIDGMRARWPVFTRTHAGRAKRRFFRRVAPLALIYEATKKSRRQLQQTRLSLQDQEASDSEAGWLSQSDGSYTVASSPETDDTIGSHVEPKIAIATFKQNGHESPGKTFEVWDIKGKSMLFRCLIVHIVGKESFALKDLHYDVIFSLYHRFSQAQGMEIDHVLFQYLDRYSRSWAVFDDMTLRSAFHQFRFDGGAHPFFLLVDDGIPRDGPLKSPYEPVRQPTPARSLRYERRRQAGSESRDDSISESADTRPPPHESLITVVRS